MPVVSADEILKFPQGKCAITAPGYSSSRQESIPYPLIIPVSKAGEKRAKESERMSEKGHLQRSDQGFSTHSLTRKPRFQPFKSTSQTSSEGLWESQVRAALESQVILPNVDALMQALYERLEEAERMLPLPDEGETPASPSKSGAETDTLNYFPKRTFTTPGLQE